MPDFREPIHWDHEEPHRAAFDGLKNSLFTALPVKVTRDSDGKTVQLQVTIKGQLTDRDGKISHVDYPLLQDVPVHFASGGEEGKDEEVVFTHPIKEGNEGLVIFSSRPLDTWFEKGGQQQAQDLRTHSLSDGMFIPGFRSKPRELKGISTTTKQLRSVKTVQRGGKDVPKHYHELDAKTGALNTVVTDHGDDQKTHSHSVFGGSDSVPASIISSIFGGRHLFSMIGGDQPSTSSVNDGAHKTTLSQDGISHESTATVNIKAPKIATDAKWSHTGSLRATGVVQSDQGLKAPLIDAAPGDPGEA